MMQKNKLRIEYSQIRANLVDVDLKNDKITENLLKFVEEKNYKKIFSYVSISSEVDTKRIISYYINRKNFGYEIYIPRTTDKIAPIKLNSFLNLKADKLGNTAEALHGNEYCGNIDIVLVPLLCFNSGLFRLGYGGGYYDRYLSAVDKSVVKIGLAFDAQLSKEFNQEVHDIPLDFIITESKILSR